MLCLCVVEEMDWGEVHTLCCYPSRVCVCVSVLQVARCTKIINADTDDPKYIINVKQFAKFVVNLHKNLAPTDVEEGMRVG